MRANPRRLIRKKRDIGTLLSEQLQAYLGSTCQIAAGRQQLWASITFSGTRYRFNITGISVDENSILKQRMSKLAEYEFNLPRYFVADILVRQHDPKNRSFEIDILAIADPVSE